MVIMMLLHLIFSLTLFDESNIVTNKLTLQWNLLILFYIVSPWTPDPVAFVTTVDDDANPNNHGNGRNNNFKLTKFQATRVNALIMRGCLNKKEFLI